MEMLTFQESFRIPRTQWVFHMEMSNPNLVPTCSNQAALVKSFEDLDKARFPQENLGGCAGQFFFVPGD